jgi:hypothetical protein
MARLIGIGGIGCGNRPRGIPTLPPRGKSVETFPLIRGSRHIARRHASAAKKPALAA